MLKKLLSLYSSISKISEEIKRELAKERKPAFSPEEIADEIPLHDKELIVNEVEDEVEYILISGLDFPFEKIEVGFERPKLPSTYVKVISNGKSIKEIWPGREVVYPYSPNYFPYLPERFEAYFSCSYPFPFCQSNLILARTEKGMFVKKRVRKSFPREIMKDFSSISKDFPFLFALLVERQRNEFTSLIFEDKVLRNFDKDLNASYLFEKTREEYWVGILEMLIIDFLSVYYLEEKGRELMDKLIAQHHPLARAIELDINVEKLEEGIYNENFVKSQVGFHEPYIRVEKEGKKLRMERGFIETHPSLNYKIIAEIMLDQEPKLVKTKVLLPAVGKIV